MKTAFLTILLTIFCAHAFGQDFQDDVGSVERYCGAREITSGDEFERVQFVGQQLSSDESRSPVDIVLIDSKVINAWTVYLNEAQALVCIPVGLVTWQNGADGELAFIIGHELGHAWDQSCKTASGRARLARKSHSAVNILFGPSQGDELGDHRNCELRSDALGLHLLVRAHYKAADAITAFERLQHFQRDRRKGVLGRLAAMGSDHPITSDRINHLKKLIEHDPELSAR